MLRRAEQQEPVKEYGFFGVAPSASEAVTAVPSADFETPPLPHDHPKWAKDAVSISQRARVLIARIKPIVIRVLTFWDHRARSIGIEGKRVSIDPSGSYRLE